MRQKRNANSITDDEYNELTKLSDQVEEIHAERIAAMVELDKYRGLGLPELMTQLVINFPG